MARLLVAALVAASVMLAACAGERDGPSTTTSPSDTTPITTSPITTSPVTTSAIGY